MKTDVMCKLGLVSLFVGVGVIAYVNGITSVTEETIKENIVRMVDYTDSSRKLNLPYSATVDWTGIHYNYFDRNLNEVDRQIEERYDFSNDVRQRQSFDQIYYSLVDVEYVEDQYDPTRLLEDGGNCQSLSLYINEACRIAGIDCDVIVTDSHMYTIVTIDGFKYKVDMTNNGEVSALASNFED